VISPLRRMPPSILKVPIFINNELGVNELDLN
jgi:hypothetical protein